MPPIVTVTVSIDCFPLTITLGAFIVAVPRAVVVPPVTPGLKVTLGATRYPEPGLVIDTDTTGRFGDSTAVADAGVVGAPPPVNPTVGALV